MHEGERGRESNQVAGEEGDFVLHIGDADAGDPSLAELVAIAVVYGVGLAGGDAVDCGIEAALTEVEIAAGHTGADLVGDVGDGLEAAAGTAAGLGKDAVVLYSYGVAAFDTSGAGVVGVDFEEVGGKHLPAIGNAEVVVLGLPVLVDAHVGYPQLIALGCEVVLEGLDVIPVSGREDGLAALGGEPCLVEADGALEGVSPSGNGTLDACGAHLAQELVAALALVVGQLYQGCVVVDRAAGALRCFFKNLVGVGPVETVEAHASGDLGADPPVGFGLSGRVHDL